MQRKISRLIALLLTVAMVLPMAVPMLPVGAAAAAQEESVIFEDSFDYAAFAYESLYDSGIWQTENKAGGGGSDGMLQPVVEDGVMKLSKKMSAQFDWLNIEDFSFDSTKTYTMQFDVTVKDFGDDSAALRRELYVAPGGYYNQVELRSDNGSKCIRTGSNYTGTKDVEYLLDTRYTVELVWEPENQKITSTLKNGDTVVSTGYRTGSGYANADAHCAHWVMRCEDGAVEIDNFSWTDGTNTYTEDFSYPAADQCMATAGYWEKETTAGFTGCTPPEFADGVVKLDTKDSIQLNWTKLVEHDVNTAYTFEFDFKVTDAGNGYTWGGVAAATRALYVAPGGYYNQIEIINATPQIRVGNTYADYDEDVYLNKDLHAKLVLEGTTITSTIYDASGNVLVTGSRTSSDYADMTVRDGAMNYLAFRCEDGAVELDNFKLSSKVVAEGITTDLQIGENQRAVYSCQLQYISDDMPKVKLNGTQIFALASDSMTICGCQVAGTYPEGVYGISVDVNPVQHMVSLEITLPDGGIVRRGLYSIISGDESTYAVETLAQDDTYVTDIAVQQYDVAVNDYTLVTTEPVYEGFNANVYNLVTSFSDPCTTRSFAWTALTSYIGSDAMAIRYRVSGTEDWTVVDAIQETEGVEITDEDYFKTDIEGLTADTTYEYQYGKKSSIEASDWSAVYTFKTAPENVEEFSFIAIGDSQGNSWNGTDNLDYMYTEAAIQESMEDGNAAFIMHAGDVVQSGQVKELWNMYFKTLGQYASSVPHFAAIGNHDAIKVSGDNAEFFFDLHFNHPNNGGTAALDTIYTSQITGTHLSALAQDADETIYSYNYGDAHFVVLNSGNYSSEDQLLLEAQRAWLKADLEANADAKWTIVMVHEPVYHRLGGSESRPWLYDVIEEYGVDLLIQGHSHLVTRTYPMKNGQIVTKENPDVIQQGTGTVYTTIGSTTNWHDGLGNNMEEIMLIKTPALEQASYTTVTVSGDQLVMTVKQLDGLVLDQFVIVADDSEDVKYAASSQWSEDNSADKAFDDDTDTRWICSAWASKGTEWIYTMLDEYALVDSVQIVEYGNRIGEYEIQYYDENGVWTTCHTGVLNETCDKSNGTVTHPVISFEQPVNCKGIRFNILGGSDASPGMREFDIFTVDAPVEDEEIISGYAASSIWSEKNAAEYAFDNDVNTQWVSGSWSSKGTEWISTVFEEYGVVDAVQIIEKGKRIGAYEIQYLDENNHWTTCYTGTLNDSCDKSGSTNTHPVIYFDQAVTCKGIRFNILGGSDASPGMSEFKLFYADIPLVDGQIRSGYYASSDDGNPVKHAFDAVDTTRWSASASENQWICAMYDDKFTMDSVEIIDAWGRLTSFEVQYFDENGTWQTCASKTCESAGVDVTHQLSFDPVTTTGIRLYMPNTPGWPSIYELKMFYEGVQLVDGKLKAGFYSSTNDGNPADKAFDNDPATRWSACAEKDQWIVASYENKFTFDSVEILEFWDRMNAFQLQYLDENGIWQTCASKAIETEDTGVDTSHALSFDPVTTNAVRLYIPDAPGWPSIYEVKLFYTGIQVVDGQLEKGCYASSIWSDSNTADMAFDNDVSTQWVSKTWSSKGTEWVGKIYDEYVDIDEIQIIESGNRIGAYEIQYIDKTGAWKTCYTGTLNETCDKTSTAVTQPAISLGKPVTCKGIRICIKGGSDASPGLFDFKTFYFDIPVSDEKIDSGCYSSSDDGNTADKAFDNDPATRWSASAQENQWICTFFDKAVTIDSVEIMDAWGRLDSFEIQYVDENKQWKTCASKTVEGEDTGLDVTHQLSFDPVTTTGMRLYIHDAPGWASIYEFKMFYTGIQVIDGKIPGGFYSSTSDGNPAQYAFDCKLDTRWSASAEKDQWVSAFYDEPITLDAVTIKEFWDRMNSFEIQYYDENGVWQTVASKTIETEDTGVDATHSLSFDDITTNGIRVFIPDAPGWPSIYEVQIFHDGYAWIDVEKKPSDYSIAVIPDQQCLTDWHPDMLYSMYQWIADNAEKENMQMIINVGDITNYPNQLQWERSRYAYDLLQNKVPYIAVPGNHDYGTTSYRDTSMMNTYFPLSMFKEMATYGGSYSEDNNLPDDVANTWQAFEIGGNRYLVLALEFGPRDSVLAWASDVVDAHPNHQVIVVTHAYMNSDGTLLDGTDSFLPSAYGILTEEGQEAPNDPDAIWEKFVKNHKNIVMVLSGHMGSPYILMRTDTGVHGNEVKQFLIDAQNEEPRLDMVAMLNFSNDGQDVEVTYYSPSKGKYLNYESQFTFHLPKQEEAVAQVGENTYVTVSEAIANANGQVVKLLADSEEAIAVSADVTIDLAGNSLSNVTVNEGATLTLVDSAADYSGAKGSATVTGKVKTFSEAEGKTYLTLEENGVYAAHRYDVVLTHISLDAGKDALGYKAKLYGDSVVQSKVTAFGFNLWIHESNVITRSKTGTDVITLRLHSILKNNGGEKNINATAFVKLEAGNETFTKTSTQQTTTMKQTLQKVNATWAAYTQTQRNAVKALCDQYYTAVSTWELDNIYPVAEDGTVNGVYEVVTGDASFDANSIQTTAENSLMLHTSANFTEGTLGANVKTSGSHDVGIIFGANEDCSSYYLFRVAAGSAYAELVKVENGIETVLDRGFHICPGYLDIRLDVVVSDGMVYCYYSTDDEKARCYAVNELELFGDRIGLWAKTAGTTFRDVTITPNKENRKADVLIFGHSYTEMWTDYASYFPEYSSIYDIGIGGTVAAHWTALTDEVISFEPKLGIYNIGINDLSSGIPPYSAVESMENALLSIKAALPEFEVVVVSVNHCPTKGDIVDQIAQMNALMRNLAASYDWIYYAEAEYLFCTDKTDPLTADPNLFIDGLHPAAEGYALLAEVIRSAAKGENQPEMDEALAQTQLAQVKSNKLASLTIYSENAYTAENWALAQSYYDAAVEKINACTTTAQLKTLDLSSEIAALQAIPNKSADLISHLANSNTRAALNADSWIQADANTMRVSGGSYALDNTTVYTDSELVFRLTGNTGNVGVGGIYIRATQNTNNGVDGYLINYSTESNLLQVWYMENTYNTDGSAATLNYLGGIVYGSYGSVVDTEFYAKIEGSKLYVNTLERHLDGQAQLFAVDLTGGGQYQVYQSGYTGILSWNSNVSFDLEISHLAG